MKKLAPCKIHGLVYHYFDAQGYNKGCTICNKIARYRARAGEPPKPKPVPGYGPEVAKFTEVLKTPWR